MIRLHLLPSALLAGAILAQPASAATVYAAATDSFGYTRVSQYDLATGNFVAGVRLDGNSSGDTAPKPWGDIGGIAFDPGGNLWATAVDSFGYTRVSQYDLVTGNFVTGIRLDGNSSGTDAPKPWGDIGGIAFDPGGNLWATTIDSFGYTRLSQYDLVTGNFVTGVRLDGNSSGTDAPKPWGDIGGIAFDLGGNFWATATDSFGYTRVSQYDLATGNFVAGVRLDGNSSGDSAPKPWGDIGGIAFRPSAAPPNPGVPEPASWALMIAGFGLVGGLARRRSAREFPAGAGA